MLSALIDRVERDHRLSSGYRERMLVKLPEADKLAHSSNIREHEHVIVPLSSLSRFVWNALLTALSESQNSGAAGA